ncbi:hypothetical protein K458DRAFT_186616 [Lentithecium fluviatile CBS 122367]|uniref:Uncharacterized protein n=1 Tax=Lentithecium fluviatile CBS 122367 TaxID=1168545 RepID=A0A6G1JAJ5_9PLEO|nr:hypothetical protein K458DRAFT_186616 [Lentithecium fluviatile CBS 122367]
MEMNGTHTKPEGAHYAVSRRARANGQLAGQRLVGRGELGGNRGGRIGNTLGWTRQLTTTQQPKPTSATFYLVPHALDLCLRALPSLRRDLPPPLFADACTPAAVSPCSPWHAPYTHCSFHPRSRTPRPSPEAPESHARTFCARLAADALRRPSL